MRVRLSGYGLGSMRGFGDAAKNAVVVKYWRQVFGTDPTPDQIAYWATKKLPTEYQDSLDPTNRKVYPDDEWCLLAALSASNGTPLDTAPDGTPCAQSNNCVICSNGNSAGGGIDFNKWKADADAAAAKIAAAKKYAEDISKCGQSPCPPASSAPKPPSKPTPNAPAPAQTIPAGSPITDPNEISIANALLKLGFPSAADSRQAMGVALMAFEKANPQLKTRFLSLASQAKLLTKMAGQVAAGTLKVAGASGGGGKLAIAAGAALVAWKFLL